MPAPRQLSGGRALPLMLLGLAAMASFGTFAAIPGEGFRPLAQLAALLPLQLAALLLVLHRPRL